METNESILTRSVVGLKDRKVLGTINELRVDCDSLAVCDYVVKSQTTNSSTFFPRVHPMLRLSSMAINFSVSKPILVLATSWLRSKALSSTPSLAR